jgi:hypothetical protein
VPWIVAGGAVLGGLIGSSSSKKAAKQQRQAAQAATAEQKRQYDTTRADLGAYRDVGQNALFTMADLLGINRTAAPVAPDRANYMKSVTNYSPGTSRWDNASQSMRIFGAGDKTTQEFDQAGYDSAMAQFGADTENWNAHDPSDYQNTLNDFLTAQPGYQFNQSEGAKAIMRQGSAAGRRMSPSTMKELLRFNSQLAEGTFGNTFSRLAGVAGMGQNSATQTGAFGANMANQVASNTMSAGNASAAGTMGQANAWGNAIGQIGNAFQQQRSLDQYLKGTKVNI